MPEMCAKRIDKIGYQLRLEPPLHADREEFDWDRWLDQRVHCHFVARTRGNDESGQGSHAVASLNHGNHGLDVLECSGASYADLQAAQLRVNELLDRVSPPYSKRNFVHVTLES